jgi:eukaryotic-like serine/threonine-protein kinase
MLGDVPEVLRRLERDAQQLRGLYDETQDALSAAGADPASPTAELRVTRAAIGARLKDAIGALETIRLNLLRLHAGSGSVESFTTHLGLALDISAEVERLVNAQAEVNQFLAPFPRRPAPTPA